MRVLPLIAAVLLLGAWSAEATIKVTDDMRLKGEDGITYAVIIDCPEKDARFGGSENGKIGSDRCGQCLVDANWGVMIKHPYDLHIKGTLVDEGGAPVTNKMVQFFFPNGWSVKTRTSETGYFRILMGATMERKSDKLLEKDLGKRKMKKEGGPEYYSLYVMPPDFKPCAAKDKEK